MQISRHWRLNSQRYRLQGIRYEDGKVSLQDRPKRSDNLEEPNPYAKTKLDQVARPQPVGIEGGKKTKEAA